MVFKRYFPEFPNGKKAHSLIPQHPWGPPVIFCTNDKLQQQQQQQQQQHYVDKIQID